MTREVLSIQELNQLHLPLNETLFLRKVFTHSIKANIVSKNILKAPTKGSRCDCESGCILQKESELVKMKKETFEVLWGVKFFSFYYL